MYLVHRLRRKKSTLAGGFLTAYLWIMRERGETKKSATNSLQIRASDNHGIYLF